MNIYAVTIDELDAAVKLLLQVYVHSTYDELYEEHAALIGGGKDELFLAEIGGAAVGVAHVSIRSDYVAGTDGGKTGYLEGIYTQPEFRGRGVARSLAETCEKWTRDNGCGAFASDCLIDNTDSYNFHLAIGFKEVERIICFVK